jgi:hypothetical protein
MHGTTLLDAADKALRPAILWNDGRSHLAGGEAQLAVSPSPARLLLFDGAIRHAGKPPNRNCPWARYTFAIKLRRG